MQTTFADVIGPEMAADIIAAFGSDALLPSPIEDGVMDISSPVGLVTGEHVWYRLWLFGLVESSDVVRQRSCGDLWRPDGRIANGYYIPDDDDTMVSIDNPPQGVHDARPI